MHRLQELLPGLAALLLRAGRRVAGLLRRTPLYALLDDTALMRAWSAAQPRMAVADVVEVIDALTGAGVRVWLAGGWGVDALAGTERRPHRDLDLVIDETQADTAQEALSSRGYTRASGLAEHVPRALMPDRLAFANRAGRLLDVHTIDLGKAPWSDPGAFSSGAVGGRTVPCLSPATQHLALTAGHELRPEHMEDLRFVRGALADAPAP